MNTVLLGVFIYIVLGLLWATLMAAFSTMSGRSLSRGHYLRHAAIWPYQVWQIFR